MLYLNEDAINQAVSMEDVMNGIDQSYTIYEQSAFNMPTRLQVQDDNNTLLLMPCFTEKYFATKLVSVFPDNKALEMPTLNGLVALNCNKTGVLKALMDGAYVTAIRTGAIGGSAIRHLAKNNVSSLAVIGTGVQGLYQTIAACEARDFKEIYVYNRTSGEKVEIFIKQLRNILNKNINIIEMNSASDAIAQADVIITATTSSEPVLPNDRDLLKGKLIIGVGSFQPTMREFPEALYEVASRIYIDTYDAIEESGDIAVPLSNNWITQNDIQTMSSYISEGKTIMDDDETIVFKSTGMALFDVVSASIIYENAVAKQIGIQLNQTPEEKINNSLTALE